MTERAEEMRRSGGIAPQARGESTGGEGMHAQAKEAKLLRVGAALCALLALGALLLFALLLSQRSAGFVLDGFKTAVTQVLPTSLPFMVIADWYVAHGGAAELPLFSKWLSWALGIPRCAVAAYICGNLCGFPIGARSIGELYASGRIDRRRAELLLPICSNPSAAFVVGFVGGLFGSLKIGVLLLCAVHISAFICGVLFRQSERDYTDFDIISKQRYDIVESVRKTAASSVSLIGYISVFACITGVLASVVDSSALRYVIFAIAEVTGGVVHLASSELPMALRICAVGFTLAFGGVCVMMQSRALVGTDELSFRPYFFLKLLQGAICSLLCLGAYLLWW